MTTLQRFVVDLLAREGALVEEDGTSLSVVANPNLADSLGICEYQDFVFDRGPSETAGAALVMDYDSPVLDRLARLLEGSGRVACMAYPLAPLKSIDPVGTLEAAVNLRNGVFRFRAAEMAPSWYVGFVLQYDALADERTSGLADVWVNPATRSIARWSSSPLDEESIADTAAPDGLTQMLTASWRLAQPAARELLLVRVRDFVDSLTRRRDRDLQRVREYYETVAQEIRRKVASRRSGVAHGHEAEVQRLQATIDGYRARVSDTAERYKVRIHVKPIAAIACLVPTWRLHVQLLRRSASAEALFTWNPIDRAIERRCCDACDRPAAAADLCDDAVHYLCSHCFSRCDVCGRPFCRACYARCPRAHG